MSVLDPIRDCLAEIRSDAAALWAVAYDPDAADPVRAGAQAWAFDRDADRLSAAIERAEAPGADASDYAACHEHETAYLIGEECPACSPGSES